MRNASTIQFRSEYGFSSPSFTVDQNGNITAKSITLTESGDTEGQVADFIVTSPSAAGFLIEGYVGTNPSLELARGRTYTFSLNLTTVDEFYIETPDGTDYNIGLTHSSGVTGSEAQGLGSGTLQFSVPNNAPDNLRYSNGSSIFGTITVVDPVGLFSTVDITATENATSSSTGALTVYGGVGIEKSLYVGELINTHDIESSTSLNIVAANEIRLIVDDSSVIGTVNSSGFSIPIIDSSINNTVIGNTVPAAGTFSTAQVTNSPTTSNDVTNKNYVDTQVTALAIALGL